MSDNTGNSIEDFRTTLQNLDGHLHVLDRPVPLEEQMAYFSFSERIKNGSFKFEVYEMTDDEIMNLLTNEEVNLPKKKSVLAALAVSRNVRCYRLLEKYSGMAEPLLENWAELALMEARIALESEFSGERQIYVSAGLGGKNGKMRYHVVLLVKKGKVLEPYQYAVVRDEGRYMLENVNCEVEHISCGERYIEMLVLVPITDDVRIIFPPLVEECNQYGDFLSPTLVMTNVEILNKEKIETLIRENERDD